MFKKLLRDFHKTVAIPHQSTTCCFLDCWDTTFKSKIHLYVLKMFVSDSRMLIYNRAKTIAQKDKDASKKVCSENCTFFFGLQLCFHQYEKFFFYICQVSMFEGLMTRKNFQYVHPPGTDVILFWVVGHFQKCFFLQNGPYVPDVCTYFFLISRHDTPISYVYAGVK